MELDACFDFGKQAVYRLMIDGLYDLPFCRTHFLGRWALVGHASELIDDDNKFSLIRDETNAFRDWT